MNAPDPLPLLTGKPDFESFARDLWEFQLSENKIMSGFAAKLGRQEKFFMPIDFFRRFEFISGQRWQPELTFRSSGTTGQKPSIHKLRFEKIYNESSLAGFRHFFPDHKYSVFALLPGYLERPDASLVHMVENWIHAFGNPASGFFLQDHAAMHERIQSELDNGNRILLIGVAHALLDFAENFPIALPKNSIVIETGGMKGRRKEIVRSELHERISAGLGIEQVQSEYGMTEMLSQAYALSAGKFHCPPWLKIIITDLHRPFTELPTGETGRINVIDLMNVHSCAFLRTDDLGKMNEDGSFEVLGRIDHSELRGCSLMYS